MKGNAQWAIAGKVSVETLEAVRAKLPRLLRGDGSIVVGGDNGFGALLVFGENAAEGESAATRLAEDAATPVYLLDFDDDAPAITEFVKGRERRRRVHPADFLEERGIIAPGFAPVESTVNSIGIVEDITPAQARKLMPKVAATAFRAHSRGTLIISTGLDNTTLALRAKRRGYVIGVDRNDGSFSVEIIEPGPTVTQFSPTRPGVNYEQVDSVLGETTLDGILRVLDIPRELLLS